MSSRSARRRKKREKSGKVRDGSGGRSRSPYSSTENGYNPQLVTSTSANDYDPRRVTTTDRVDNKKKSESKKTLWGILTCIFLVIVFGAPGIYWLMGGIFIEQYLAMTLPSVIVFGLWALVAFSFRKKINDIAIMITSGVIMIYAPIFFMITLVYVPEHDQSKVVYGKISADSIIAKVYSESFIGFDTSSGSNFKADLTPKNITVKFYSEQEEIEYKIYCLPLSEFEIGYRLPVAIRSQRMMNYAVNVEIGNLRDAIEEENPEMPYLETADLAVKRYVDRWKIFCKELTYEKKT